MGKHKYFAIDSDTRKMRRARDLRRRGVVLLPLLIIASLLVPTLHPFQANAATYTWDGGCGVDTDWSCAANWSSDIVPTATDSVVFNDTSDGNSTIDSLFNASETVAAININGNYDGTITAATTLHVTGGYTQNGGTFNGANQVQDYNGNWAFTGGTYTSSSGNTTLAGGMTVTGTPTFNANGGTWTLDGSTATIACNGITFNLVVINHSSGSAKTISAGCTLPLGSDPNTNAGNVILNGTLSGSGTLTHPGAAFTYGTTGSLSGFTGLATSQFTLNGTLNAGSYTTFTVGSTFTLGATSVLTAPSGTMSIAGALTVTAGATFNHNSGTVNFNGSTNVALSCSSITFNRVTFTHSGGAKTVNSNCSLPLGNNPSLPTSVSLAGTLSGTGTLTSAAGTLTINSTGSLSGFSGLAVVTNLTVASATLNLSSYTTVDIDAALALTGTAVFTAPSGTMSVAGNISIATQSAYNSNGGTLVLDGTGSTSVTCTAATSFSMVTFAHTGGSKAVGAGCTMALGNNPTIPRTTSSSGTLTGTGTLTVSLGAFTLNSGGAFSGFTGFNVPIFTTADTEDFSGYSTFVSSGAVTLNSGANISFPNGTDINGTFTLNSGATMTAPSGSASFSADFTLAAGSTFNHNNGTIVFDSGNNHRIITCNGATFNLVQFTHSNYRKTVSSGCTLPLGNNPSSGSLFASIVLSGTLTGTGTFNPAGFTIESTGAISGFSGYLSNGNLAINDATVDFSGMTSFVQNNTYVQTGGTVSMPSGADFNSTFSQIGGTFNAPSGNIYFSGMFAIQSSGVFNHNNGTVIFDGSADTSIDCDNALFNLVDFAHLGTKTVGPDCTLPVGNDPTLGNTFLFLAGSITLSGGEITGSGELTIAGEATLETDAILTGFDGFTSGALTIVNEDFNFSAMNPFTHTSYSQTGGTVVLPTSGAMFLLNFELIGGTVTAPSGTMYVGGNFDISAPSTFNHNNGTVTFSDNILTLGSTISCDNETFNVITFTHADYNKHVEEDCSLPLGNNPGVGNGGDISIDGTLSGTGTIDVNGSLTVYDNSSLSGFTGLEAEEYIHSGGTKNFGSYNTFDIDGLFEVGSNGTFTAPSGNMTVAGDFTILSDGAFNHNNGTLILDGNNQEIEGTTFYNLNKTVSTAATLTLPAGSTEVVQGDLTLKGAAGQLLSLVSSDPGNEQWEINVTGTHDIEYVSVTDSNNIGSTLSACNSTNGGNNIGWDFTCDPDDPDPDPDPDDGDNDDDESSDSEDDEDASGSGDQEVAVGQNGSGVGTDEENTTDDESVDDEENGGETIVDTDFPDYGGKKTASSSFAADVLKITGLVMAGITGVGLLWWIIAKRRRNDDNQPLLP